MQPGRVVIFVVAVVVAGTSGFGLYRSMDTLKLLLKPLKSAPTQHIEHAALHSFLEFTLFGIKNGWCFRKDWLWEKKSDCNWNHPRNALRVITTQDVIAEIQKMRTISPGSLSAVNSDFAMERIDHSVNLTQIDDKHPLRRTLGSLDLSQFLKIDIAILRDTRGLLNSSLSQVPLIIELKLIPKRGSDKGEVNLVSHVVVQPRVIGDFALIHQGDLQLSKATQMNASGIAVPRGSAYGVHFESPVYVQGHVILPNRKSFNQVTFSEKLVLSEKSIVQSGKTLSFSPYRAAETPEDKLDSIGGFLGGVEYETYPDLGLRSLFAQSSGGSLSLRKKEICAKEYSYEADFKNTENSILAMRKLQESYSKKDKKYFVSYELALTDNNTFRPQTYYKSEVRDIKGAFHSTPRVVGLASIGPVVRTKFRVRARNSTIHSFEVSLAHDATVTTQFRFFKEDSVKAAAELAAEPKVSQEELTGKRDQLLENRSETISEIDSNIQRIQDEIDQLKRDNEEVGRDTFSDGAVQTINREIERRKGELTKVQNFLDKQPNNPVLKDEVKKAKSSLRSAQQQLMAQRKFQDAQKILQGNQKKIKEKQVELRKLYESKEKIDDEFTTKLNKVAETKKKVGSKKDNPFILKWLRELDKKAGKLTVKLEPVKQDGVLVKNKIKLSLWFDSLDGFGVVDTEAISKTKKIGPVVVEAAIEAFDSAYRSGISMRERIGHSVPSEKLNSSSSNERTGVLTFLLDANRKSPKALVSNTKFLPAQLAGLPGKPKEKSFVSVNSRIVPKFCVSSSRHPLVQSGFYQPLLKENKFLPITQKVWRQIGDLKGALKIDSRYASRMNPIFFNYSDLGRCVVNSSAEFVFGFFACKRFEIQPRKLPLRIVGTVVTDQLVIDESAVRAGINWSSMGMVGLSGELNLRGVLRSGPNRYCDNRYVRAKWQPYLSFSSNMYADRCRPEQFREKLGFLDWTTLVPACGPLNDGIQYGCDVVPRRFTVTEVSRREFQ